MYGYDRGMGGWQDLLDTATDIYKDQASTQIEKDRARAQAAKARRNLEREQADRKAAAASTAAAKRKKGELARRRRAAETERALQTRQGFRYTQLPQFLLWGGGALLVLAVGAQFMRKRR